MKNAGTTKVTHNLNDPPVPSGTDWSSVDAMTDADIHAGALSDADAQPLPETGSHGMTKLVNVKKLRMRLSLTQEAFASTYRIPLGTLRDWEQRRKHPDAPARAYLTVIAASPDAVAAMLNDAA
jgi:putative transcriptional regulator